MPGLQSDDSRSSPSSLSSSCLSESDSGSESESVGPESEFYPGRLGLKEEQDVVSFQLEDEDYPEEVLLSYQLKREDTEADQEEQGHCLMVEEQTVISVSPSSLTLPPFHVSYLYSSSLTLSPILKRRNSSRPYI